MLSTPYLKPPPEITVQAFQINTFAALYTTQACLDMLIESKGVVANISSESSPFRTPFQYYQASKAALEAISDVMRRELIMFGVHVAIIRPGAIKTELLEGTKHITNALENSRFQEHFQKFATGAEKRSPKSQSQPSEVAALVYHAATDPKRKTPYTINNMFFLKIMKRLPAKLADKLLAKQM